MEEAKTRTLNLTVKCRATHTGGLFFSSYQSIFVASKYASSIVLDCPTYHLSRRSLCKT